MQNTKFYSHVINLGIFLIVITLFFGGIGYIYPPAWNLLGILAVILGFLFYYFEFGGWKEKIFKKKSEP